MSCERCESLCQTIVSWQKSIKENGKCIKVFDKQEEKMFWFLQMKTCNDW